MLDETSITYPNFLSNIQIPASMWLRTTRQSFLTFAIRTRRKCSRTARSSPVSAQVVTAIWDSRLIYEAMILGNWVHNNLLFAVPNLGEVSSFYNTPADFLNQIFAAVVRVMGVKNFTTAVLPDASVSSTMFRACSSLRCLIYLLHVLSARRTCAILGRNFFPASQFAVTPSLKLRAALLAPSRRSTMASSVRKWMPAIVPRSRALLLLWSSPTSLPQTILHSHLVLFRWTRPQQHRPQPQHPLILLLQRSWREHQEACCLSWVFSHQSCWWSAVFSKVAVYITIRGAPIQLYSTLELSTVFLVHEDVCTHDKNLNRQYQIKIKQIAVVNKSIVPV